MARWLRNFFHRAAEEIAKMDLSSCIPLQPMVNILWSYGKVRLCYPRMHKVLVSEIKKRLQRYDVFKTQELANTVWA